MVLRTRPSTDTPKSATPLPWYITIILPIIQASEAFQIVVLFPFVVQQVIFFDIAKNETEIGFYTGLLATVFGFGQFLTAPVWGWFGDKVGAQKSIMFGVVGACVSFFIYGVSTNYWVALTARFCGGMLNGNIAIMKAFIARSTDKTNRAKAFGILSSAWGGGTIVAQVLGGYLSEPEKQYGGNWWIFGYLPFLLPVLIGNALQVLAFVTCLIGLRNVATAQRVTVQPYNQNPDEDLEMLNLNEPQEGDDYEDPIDDELYKMGSDEETPDQQNGTRVRGVYLKSLNSDLFEQQNDDNEGARLADHREPLAVAVSPRMGVISMATPSGPRDKLNAWPTVPNEKSKRCSCLPVWVNADTNLMMGMFFLLAVLAIAFDELMPLWTQFPIELGGLGYNTQQTGTTLLVGGIVLLVWQLFGVGRMARLFGESRSLVILCWCSFGMVGLYALVAAVRQYTWLGSFIALMGVVAFRSCVIGGIFTFCNVLLQETAPVQYLGVLNGVGQSVGCLARAFGPITVGAAWSLSTKYPLPFNMNFGFVFQIILSGVLSLLAVMKHKKGPPKYKLQKEAEEQAAHMGE